MDFYGVPIVVSVRDRLSDLLEQLAWFERAGYRNILLIDNASTYPPLLDWLETEPQGKGYKLMRLKTNVGSRAPWLCDVPERCDWMLYTDCDVVPWEQSPFNIVERLWEILTMCKHPEVSKAGPGLHLYDVPRDPPFRHRALEASFWSSTRRCADCYAYRAPIETTMALYRPGVPFSFDALRSEYPYVAHHLPWYRAANPTEEDLYYLSRARVAKWAEDGNVTGGSDWAGWFHHPGQRAPRGPVHSHTHGDHEHRHDHESGGDHEHGFLEPCGGVDDF